MRHTHIVGTRVEFTHHGVPYSAEYGFMRSAHGREHGLTFGLLAGGRVIFADWSRGLFEEIAGHRADDLDEARALVARHYIRGYDYVVNLAACKLPMHPTLR